jgi:hypothetical protein
MGRLQVQPFEWFPHSLKINGGYTPESETEAKIA